MNKHLLIAAAAVALCGQAAHADNFNLTIGTPAVVEAPPPAYVVEPETVVVGGRYVPAEPHHFHRADDREYWKRRHDHR